MASDAMSSSPFQNLPAQSSSVLPVSVLGQGYNTFTGSALPSSAVKGTTATNGVTNSLYCKVCKSTEELHSALNISAAVSANFGFDSVDAKTKFVSSLNITSTAVTVVVYASVISSNNSYVKDLTLTAAAPATESEARIFFQKYGDSFVSQVISGAEFIATYVFFSQSEEDKQSLVASLSGKGLVGDGTVTASLQASLSDLSKQSSMQMEQSQIIIGITHAKSPEPDGIVQYAQDFSSLPVDAPAVISYQVIGYEHVPGFQAQPFDQVAVNRARFTGDGSGPGVSSTLARLAGVNNQINQVSNAYRIYNYAGDTELTTKQQQICSDMTLLSTWVSKVSNDPTQSPPVPPAPSLNLGSPSFNPILVTTPSISGGNGGGTYIGGGGDGGGGGAFQDVMQGTPQDPSSSISIGVYPRISSINASGGLWIDQLQTTYGYGSQQPQMLHGGGGGSPSYALNMQEGEFVTSISGTAGKYVNQLSITTNKGQTWTWPSKPQSAPSYSFTVPDGQVLVGFQGRAGQYLDQLQPVCIKLQPANWEPLQS